MTPASLLAIAVDPKPVPGTAVRGRVIRREKVPEKSGEVVEILRGDLYERRDFQSGASK